MFSLFIFLCCVITLVRQSVLNPHYRIFRTVFLYYYNLVEIQINFAYVHTFLLLLANLNSTSVTIFIIEYHGFPVSDWARGPALHHPAGAPDSAAGAPDPSATGAAPAVTGCSLQNPRLHVRGETPRKRYILVAFCVARVVTI